MKTPIQNPLFWDLHSCWEEAEKLWDETALHHHQQHPLKTLKQLPNIVGMTPETKKHLTFKSLWYLIRHDRDLGILKGFLKHPFRYAYNFIQSAMKKKSFRQEGDFFYYGTESLDTALEASLKKENVFILGFSYCHKPFECPSGRFSDQCIHDAQSPICSQCFIGKAIHASDSQTHVIIIPTIHYIGKKFFELINSFPQSQLTFMITACELTLNMFGDLGNMVNAQGIGIRLDGRICNTMKAFELSEEGIKPGLTVVLPPTQEKILNFIKARRLRTMNS